MQFITINKKLLKCSQMNGQWTRRVAVQRQIKIFKTKGELSFTILVGFAVTFFQVCGVVVFSLTKPGCLMQQMLHNLLHNYA